MAVLLRPTPTGGGRADAGPAVSSSSPSAARPAPFDEHPSARHRRTPPVSPSGTDHDALPPGTRLGEFEIVRVLGVGGFGIVYLAQGPFARARGRDQGIHAGVAGGARPRAADHACARASFAETFAHRPALLRQRGAAAGALRPPVAGQGVPLLGGQRHRVHGDALPAGHDAARHAPGAWPHPPDEAWLPQRHRAAARRRSSCCTAKASTTATSRPTTSCCRTTGRRCCSTSAPRGASSATARSR